MIKVFVGESSESMTDAAQKAAQAFEEYQSVNDMGGNYPPQQISTTSTATPFDIGIVYSFVLTVTFIA